MLLKSKWFIFVSALVCMSHLFAATENNMLTCPSANAIQEGGLMGAMPYFQKSYMTFNLSNYDTSVNWTFVMGRIVAKSEQDALDKGQRLLATLSGTPTPQQNEEGDWACLYHTQSPKVVAAAVFSERAISIFELGNTFSRF